MSLDATIVQCVRKVMIEFGGEWDDLYQQAYVIAMEKTNDFDPERGAAFETFMHHQIYGNLRNYALRYVIKESTGNGYRVQMNPEDTDSVVDFPEDQIDARMRIDSLLEKTDSVSGDIINMLLQGYTYREIGEELGMSYQAVHQRVQKMREELAT